MLPKMRSSYRSVRLKSASDSSCHAVPIFVTQWVGLDALERQLLLLAAFVAGASVEDAARQAAVSRRTAQRCPRETGHLKGWT